MTTVPGFGLALGDLELMGNIRDEVSIEALAAGSTFGDPEPVGESIANLMLDGEPSRNTRFSNRTAKFLIKISANDHHGLALGGAMLDDQLDRPNLLTYRVPYGPPTSWDVTRSWSRWLYDDLSEAMRVTRVFEISVECWPFGRSKDKVTVTWDGQPLSVAAGTTTVVARNYLRFGSDPGEVRINGTLIPESAFGVFVDGGSYYDVPTFEWCGEQVTVEASQGSQAVYYPNRSTNVMKGIDAMPVFGTARAPFEVSWPTNYNDPLALYTASDPSFDIRRGMPEVVWTWGVTDDPPDNYLISSASTAAQLPLSVRPWGSYPQESTFGTTIPALGLQVAYPAGDYAAMSFWQTGGEGLYASPSVFQPMGYHGGAIANEKHALHPSLSGFALIGDDGLPVECEISYFPRWKHLAAL